MNINYIEGCAQSGKTTALIALLKGWEYMNLGRALLVVPTQEMARDAMRRHCLDMSQVAWATSTPGNLISHISGCSLVLLDDSHQYPQESRTAIFAKFCASPLPMAQMFVVR